MTTVNGENAHVITEPEKAHDIKTSTQVAQINAGSKEEPEKIISDDTLPSQVVDDLLSIGVCTRCIYRLFGIHKQSNSCSLLSPSISSSVLENPNSSDDRIIEKDGLFKVCEGSEVCCICLGVLQFRFTGEKENLVKKEEYSNDVVETIVKSLKQEGHEIDGFSLEVSIPPIILANDRSIRLYVKKKYESEMWFKEKFLSGQISVKDALKFSITNSLETLLAAKSGVGTFRIRLTYTHDKASLKLENCLEKENSYKRRRTGTENGESDAAISNSLDRLQDHVFCERFKSPPEKVSEPCHLQLLCCRTPIYIGGRYLKYSRNVSQSRWVIDDERMGEASVEEIIGSQILPICKGDNYKFHAAGREDIDVRMLGSGRPFLVEVHNARHVPSQLLIEEMEQKINNVEGRLVSVRNLKVLESGTEGWTLMREGEAEKQKQYAALVWISRPLEDEDVRTLTSFEDLSISQRTPIRVLHRRSPLDREKIIHWMKIELIAGSTQYFLLHLCTQAGTYIKEFVHGDLGRTHPNLGSILGCRAEILQLDVTDVKMDCFN